MKQLARNQVEASTERGGGATRTSRHVADRAGSYIVQPIDCATEVSIADVVVGEIDSSGPVDDFTYLDIGSVDRERKAFAAPKIVPRAEAPSRAKQRVEAGDVLVSMTRPNLNAVALVTQKLHGSIASTGFHVLRSSWLEPGFLYYLVQTDAFVDAMCDVVQGALYPAVRPRDIERFKFRLPPGKEQTRIVENLEELLSDLDAGVAELKAAQRKLAQYRQSLLKAAVEGALTADWRAARATTSAPQETGAELLQRILTERRGRWETRQLAKFAEKGKTPPKGWQTKYKAPVAPDTTGLPELPEGWGWASVDQCALDESAITDGPFGSNLKSSHYTESGPRVLRLQNIGDGYFVNAKAHISESHYAALTKHAVVENDVVIAMLGEVLPRACIVPRGVAPAIVKADCARVRANPALLLPELLSAVLNSKPTRTRVLRMVKGIGRPRVNLRSLRSIAIPLPPVAEQQAIRDTLMTALDASQTQSEALQYGLRQSAAQRKNILKAAFAGLLVPQDPDDEPASVLLERIRAERAARATMAGKRRRKPARIAATESR